MIAFYYGINGYAVPIFYRHQIFGSVKKFLLLGLFPLLGGLALTWVLIASLDSLWYPANSESGTSWFGVGPPFVLGVGFIVSGSGCSPPCVLMRSKPSSPKLRRTRFFLASPREPWRR